jgi:hypothetical protein
MSVTVNDRIESEEIGRFDVLVTCGSSASPTSSSSFNVTLMLPPSGGSSGTSIDRTLEVILDDATNERRVYLTSFDLHRHRPATTPPPNADSPVTSFMAEYVSHDDEGKLSICQLKILLMTFQRYAQLTFSYYVCSHHVNIRRVTLLWPVPLTFAHVRSD